RVLVTLLRNLPFIFQENIPRHPYLRSFAEMDHVCLRRLHRGGKAWASRLRTGRPNMKRRISNMKKEVFGRRESIGNRRNKSSNLVSAGTVLCGLVLLMLQDGPVSAQAQSIPPTRAAVPLAALPGHVKDPPNLDQFLRNNNGGN